MSAKARRFTSKGRAAARFVAQRGLLVPVAWSTVKVEVHGVKNLKKVGRSFIVIANHSSHLDAPLILGSLPMRMSRYLAAGAATRRRRSSPPRRRPRGTATCASAGSRG